MNYKSITIIQPTKYLSKNVLTEDCHDLDINTNNVSIEPYGFVNCNDLWNVKFADDTILGQASFKNCKYLNLYNLPKVKIIPACCFESCEQIRVLELPSTIKIIEKGAFENSGLESIILNNGLSSIQDYAFKGTNIYEIVIPKSVNEIEKSAFDNCANLNVIHYYNILSVCDLIENPDLKHVKFNKLI